MYFDAFPYIYYDSKGDGDFKVVTNLLRRVAVRTKVKSNTALFDTYEIKEGESPESIAYHLYGNSELHWLILLFNDIVDRYHGWPLRRMQLLSYVADKYSDPNGTHHYEIAQTSGDTSKKINIGTDNTDYPSASIVTNFEYEEEEQDKKRKIRLLDPAYVTTFVEEFTNLMSEETL